MAMKTDILDALCIITKEAFESTAGHIKVIQHTATSLEDMECRRGLGMSSGRKKHGQQDAQTLDSWKLPRRYIAFRLHNKDTHASLDALMPLTLPASQRNVGFGWANRASIGSKDHRGDPNKSDGTIVKDVFEVGFVEVEAPREERYEKAFLEDQWALATFAKDVIDYHLRHGLPFKIIPCLQVFGYRLILYKLEFISGLCMANCGTYMNDRGIIAGSHFIKKIETECYVHTPPKKALDEDLPDELRPRSSSLTLKRPSSPSAHNAAQSINGTT
ncbi:MAG: hypothetical protein J3R72DRAFT_496739 [Linnemannia gamsii]|nr:MAG: hypothetical protein J3R72DRAFT_496739 [Linnemannia gamsii]